MHFIKDIESGKKNVNLVYLFYVNIDMYVHVYPNYIYYTYTLHC